MRWIRDDDLLFVEWKDTREVVMCSSFHSANGDRTVQRKVKTRDQGWVQMSVPIPSVVSDYNKNMGGVDLSDALISYYTVLRKTRKWYRSLFYHLIDIGVVNAFILHQQMAALRNQRPKTQKEFREALVLELVDWIPHNQTSSAAPAPAPQSRQDTTGHHRPKHIDGSRRRCKVCHQKTSVFCNDCGSFFCFFPMRDCFNPYHDDL
nr:piggyBac transposable element-derived protein 4-like [Misgurnus anguillicaudatus]